MVMAHLTDLRSKSISLLGKPNQMSMKPSENMFHPPINSFVDNNDIYYPELSFYMKHLCYYNPTILQKNYYLVSLKYDFNELRSQTWLYIENYYTD